MVKAHSSTQLCVPDKILTCTGMYKCNHCPYKGKSPIEYTHHYAIHRHVNQVGFPCGVPGCPRTFKLYSSFSTHLSRDHRNYRHVRQNVEANTGNLPISTNSADNVNNLVSPNLTCDHCKKLCDSPAEIMRHLKEHIREGIVIKCPIHDCSSKYKVASSFTSHMSRCHNSWSLGNMGNQGDVLVQVVENENTAVGPIIPEVNIENNVEPACPEAAVMDHDGPEENDPGDETDTEGLSDNVFLESVALFYLKLEAKFHIPQSAIQEIVTSVCDFHKLSQYELQLQLKKLLWEEGVTDEKIGYIVEDVFKSDFFEIVHDGTLRSNYTRKKYYKESFDYVIPVSVGLGRDKDNIDRHYHYVPIKETITTLFKDLTMQKLYELKRDPKPGVYQDFQDGEVFKTNELFGNVPGALSLVLYQDAFEVVNPLGSSKIKHKILAVYLTLGNICPQHRSKVEPLQLVLLCREKDFKYFKMDKIFARLVSDLKDIEEQGLQIDSNDNGNKVLGSVLFFLGDNLGSHCIGGFSENFSTQPYMCRYCLITNKEFAENPLTVSEQRTVTNYSASIDILEEGEISMHQGIVRASPFNTLKYLHVCSPALPPCLGHDLFEGIVRYDLAFFIKDLVKKGWFNYDFLNRMIRKVSLKLFDMRDKPPDLSSKGEKLSGHAAENWCLLRNLPLFLHLKVQNPEDETWKLILLLREIVELVCSPKIAEGQVAYLLVLIEEYLNERKNIFPDVKLRPKHHYLIHYPRLILQCGPLIRSWTMRFESKHAYFKTHVRHCANFINLTKSLTTKHQLLQAYLRQGEYFCLGVSAVSSIPFHPELYTPPLAAAVKKCGMHKESDLVHISDKVTIDGTEYCKGMYLVIRHPTAGRFRLYLADIVSMMIDIGDSSTCHFVVKLNIGLYNMDLGVYEVVSMAEAHETTHVTNADAMVCLDRSRLLDYQPLNAYRMDDNMFIALKHSICFGEEY
ncbi:uncharacterized protein LOC135496511 [Lineus longissimus]|uniref:uncharacterized protein LOC135496511 n=1 Tax=Lineus longissimus TaxID=88925 RepID=UPI00315D5341